MDRLDNFSPGYCEYLVDGFADKKIVAIRVLALVAGAVLCFLLFQLLSFIPQVFAVWLVVIIALEVILIRSTKREFEYTVAMGEMTIEAIYGKRWRRKMFSVRVADIEKVFPVDSVRDAKIMQLNPTRIVVASPKKSEYLYCIYTKKDGGKNSATAVVFSSCKKLNDAIKFYNRHAICERT